MWYISGCNGGRYGHIKWEYPCDPILDKMITSLKQEGKDIWVKHVQYEYNGYSGDVMMINDETLETIYVDHHITWGHSGTSYWLVEVREPDYTRYTVYDSRLSQPIVGLYLLDVWTHIVNMSKRPCLPSPGDFLFRQLDTLHMQVFNCHAKDYRDKFPHAWEILMECDMAGLKAALACKESQSKTSLEDVSVI